MFDLFQRLEEVSLGRAGFGVEGGTAEEIYISDAPVSAEDVSDALLEILGDVSKGSGRLNRKLPLAHPEYPWLFASKVDVQRLGLSDIEGNTSQDATADISLEAEPIVDQYAEFVRVQLRVTFTPRPYALLQDSAITTTSTTYTNDAGGSSSYTDSQEYWRYTFPELDINPQIVKAQKGEQYYRTSSGDPGGFPFNAFPYAILPDGTFKVTWYQVPHSLFLDASHPMRTLVGRVNYSTFFDQPAGSLLYMGPKARVYTPVVPASENWLSDWGGTSFSAEKLADITFHFLYTARTATNAPTPSNASWIYSGHNAEPWLLTGKFYAVSSPGATSASWVPRFLSAPMQRLFEV